MYPTIIFKHSDFNNPFLVSENDEIDNIIFPFARGVYGDGFDVLYFKGTGKKVYISREGVPFGYISTGIEKLLGNCQQIITHFNLSFFLLKNLKNSSVTKVMQRLFKFFRRKNYGAKTYNYLLAIALSWSVGEADIPKIEEFLGETLPEYFYHDIE